MLIKPKLSILPTVIALAIAVPAAVTWGESGQPEDMSLAKDTIGKLERKVEKCHVLRRKLPELRLLIKEYEQEVARLRPLVPFSLDVEARIERITTFWGRVECQVDILKNLKPEPSPLETARVLLEIECPTDRLSYVRQWGNGCTAFRGELIWIGPAEITGNKALVKVIFPAVPEIERSKPFQCPATICDWEMIASLWPSSSVLKDEEQRREELVKDLESCREDFAELEDLKKHREVLKAFIDAVVAFCNPDSE